MKFQCPNCYAIYNYDDEYKFFEKLTCSICTKTYLTSEFLKHENKIKIPKYENKIEENIEEKIEEELKEEQAVKNIEEENNSKEVLFSDFINFELKANIKKETEPNKTTDSTPINTERKNNKQEKIKEELKKNYQYSFIIIAILLTNLILFYIFK